MEVGTLDNLRRLVGRMESYPQFKARLEQHIRETEGQERRLKWDRHDRGLSGRAGGRRLTCVPTATDCWRVVIIEDACISRYLAQTRYPFLS